MDVATIKMPAADADKAYQDYLGAVKTRKEKYLEDLKKVYHALKNGKKIIDIFEAFKLTGIGEDGNPKLAISLANEKRTHFIKENGGSGKFAVDSNGWEKFSSQVALPDETFCENWPLNEQQAIKDRLVQTNVPVIPAHLLPSGKLDGYYILWEVNEWLPIAKAVDPFLLKRINLNTFVVLAEWDLTEVEQIVMRGR